MAVGEVRIGDIGFIFNFTVKDQDGDPVDVSTATTKKIILRKPDGSAMIDDVAFTSTGSDGKVRWWVSSGELDQVGDWQFQLYLVLSVNTYHSDIHNVFVHPNLPEPS